MQRLENLQEDVLGEILGLVVAAGELVGDVEHFAPVLADDFFPCALIAPEATRDQGVNGISTYGRRIRHAPGKGSVPGRESYLKRDKIEGVLADIASAVGTPL